MKNLKKLILSLMIFSISSFAFSKTVTFNHEKFFGTITYNDDAELGNAIAVRLNIKFAKNQKKKISKEPIAVLKLFKDEKQINVSRFFNITQPKEKTYKSELLALLPLSTWLKTDGDFSLKIIFDPQIDAQQEVNIPVNIVNKTFICETIDLNEANSKIKSNMSIERLNQIEKLNAILETQVSEDVFDLKNFVKPVESNRITGTFGDRRIYKYANNETSTSMHLGLDYGVPEGTKVTSCASGKVVMAEERISTGWSVVIEHLPGLYSLYYHLSSLNVKEGQNVKRGELIGLSGSTGLATGPHLHWEVRLNSEPVSPEFFLDDYTFNEGELN